jgi:hypothetical protein
MADILVLVIVVGSALVFVRHGGCGIWCMFERRKLRFTFRGRKNVAGIMADVGLSHELASLHVHRWCRIGSTDEVVNTTTVLSMAAEWNCLHWYIYRTEKRSVYLFAVHAFLVSPHLTNAATPYILCLKSSVIIQNVTIVQVMSLRKDSILPFAHHHLFPVVLFLHVETSCASLFARVDVDLPSPLAHAPIAPCGAQHRDDV